MDTDKKKAALEAYRERKVEKGVYSLRCTATGECWVGRAQDLGTIQNRVRFTLSLGTNPHRSLQAAWKTHGEGSFTFEVMEKIPQDEPPEAHDRVLKEMLLSWEEKLSAKRI